MSSKCKSLDTFNDGSDYIKMIKKLRSEEAEGKRKRMFCCSYKTHYYFMVNGNVMKGTVKELK